MQGRLEATLTSHIALQGRLEATTTCFCIWLCRDGSSRQASLVRLGNMEAVSSEAAVYHVSAVAAQLEARDNRIGEASGKCPLPGCLLVW